MSNIRFSCLILMKLEFSRQFFCRKILKQNLMKIRPVGAELLHVDRRTDGQTWRSEQSLYAILRTRLNNLLSLPGFDPRIVEAVA
jgi:hypothetical protein